KSALSGLLLLPCPINRPFVIGNSSLILLPSTMPQPAVFKAGMMYSVLVSCSFILLFFRGLGDSGDNCFLSPESPSPHQLSLFIPLLNPRLCHSFSQSSFFNKGCFQSLHLLS